MKAFVDEDTCIGCTLCASTCPDIYTMNDDGKAEAISDEIPDGMEESAKEARDECPVDAISIE